MKIIKVTKYDHMASGRNFCALAEDQGKKFTSFGRTEKEAIENAKR